MKSIKSIFALLLISMAFTGIFCNSRKVTPAADMKSVNPQDSLELTGYSVHLVKLPFEYITQDKQGNKMQYSQAWLVKLQLKNMSPYPAQRVDFAIGDYIIPEYGGWENGIYFRIYEQALLDTLNNREIRYRLPGSDRMIPTKRMLQLPVDKKLELEDENIVLGRKK